MCGGRARSSPPHFSNKKRAPVGALFFLGSRFLVAVTLLVVVSVVILVLVLAVAVAIIIVVLVVALALPISGAVRITLALVPAKVLAIVMASACPNRFVTGSTMHNWSMPDRRVPRCLVLAMLHSFVPSLAVVFAILDRLGPALTLAMLATLAGLANLALPLRFAVAGVLRIVPLLSGGVGHRLLSAAMANRVRLRRMLCPNALVMGLC